MSGSLRRLVGGTRYEVVRRQTWELLAELHDQRQRRVGLPRLDPRDSRLGHSNAVGQRLNAEVHFNPTSAQRVFHEPQRSTSSNMKSRGLLRLAITTHPHVLLMVEPMSKRVGNPKQQLQPTYIREWRKYRGLSQDRLVERVREQLLGFSKSTLSRVETGKQPYTQPILEALADALNCAPADLLMRDPSSPIWSIMDAVKALKPTEQNQVAAIIEAFRKAS